MTKMFIHTRNYALLLWARLSLTHAKITSLPHAYVTCTCTHFRCVTCTCTHLPSRVCRHYIEDLEFWVSGFGGFGVFGVSGWGRDDIRFA